VKGDNFGDVMPRHQECGRAKEHGWTLPRCATDRRGNAPRRTALGRDWAILVVHDDLLGPRALHTGWRSRTKTLWLHGDRLSRTKGDAPTLRLRGADEPHRGAPVVNASHPGVVRTPVYVGSGEPLSAEALGWIVLRCAALSVLRSSGTLTVTGQVRLRGSAPVRLTEDLEADEDR